MCLRARAFDVSSSALALSIILNWAELRSSRVDRIDARRRITDPRRRTSLAMTRPHRAFTMILEDVLQTWVRRGIHHGLEHAIECPSVTGIHFVQATGTHHSDPVAGTKIQRKQALALSVTPKGIPAMGRKQVCQYCPVRTTHSAPSWYAAANPETTAISCISGQLACTTDAEHHQLTQYCPSASKVGVVLQQQ